MTFPGRFTDQLMADRLDHVSLSFLVDDLEVRHGGVGANIAYGLARLGERPTLVAAVGQDFDDYGRRLRSHGVDLASVRVSASRRTARFVCTTDRAGNQIASFYPGAMSEAAGLDLADVTARTGRPDLVLVGPDDPDAMLRHTAACRALGYAFAADPSQQLARIDRSAARALVTGATYLFTNEYEGALLLRRAGWTTADVLGRVGVWITTLGEKGVRLERAGEPAVEVPAVTPARMADPTGAGDAFRAGFTAARLRGTALTPAAQAGCALAAYALESVGTQEYAVDDAGLATRLARVYGPQAAGAFAEVSLP
ncbi:carbohydrate kinase family protein [Streptomyces sp. NPDC096205]|uniref:carbohydrate kinase family protein n=1 Tax=Streptomyces sp. NPDC096205 TaxID=3366081 RepID=UPI00382CE801